MTLVHSSVCTNFERTPDGNIYDKDLKDVFSMLIICLKLGSPPAKFKLTKSFPYSFTINQALTAMANLSISIDLPTVTTNVSYTIKTTLGLDFLRKFYARKLLHSPADRTRAAPAPNVLLQPTPKGVAIVDEFCTKIGMTKLPEILTSLFNSMDLIRMDRDFHTDEIIYSEYFINLLFIRMLGDTVNVWGPNNKPDEIKTKVNVGMGDGFDFSPPTSLTSPLHHRFFTNPESDAHTQYYVSTSGVRVFRNKVFELDDGADVVVNFCMSGKAVVQWLTDCSDVTSEQALEIAQLFLKYRLLSAVRMRSPNSRFTHPTVFSKDRNAFYYLSPLGKKLCNWKEFSGLTYTKVLPSQLLDQGEGCESILSDNASSDQQLTLKAILKDQGLKYLFKKHLESEYCGENLDAYLQLRNFGSRKDKLAKLLSARRHLDEPSQILGPNTTQFESDISSISSIQFVTNNTVDLIPAPKTSNESEIDKQITHLASSCLTLAFQIFFT